MYNQGPDIRLAKTIICLQKVAKLILQEDVDEDAIDDHVEELRKDPYNEDSANISTLLQLGLYENALSAIKSFIGGYTGGFPVHDILSELIFVKMYKR